MKSALLERLMEKGLFERIPATFSTYFLEQMKDWETLFPAERYFERLFTLLDLLPATEFAELSSSAAAEQKMERMSAIGPADLHARRWIS
jgi:hypothetical protein